MFAARLERGEERRRDRGLVLCVRTAIARARAAQHPVDESAEAWRRPRVFHRARVGHLLRREDAARPSLARRIALAGEERLLAPASPGSMTSVVSGAVMPVR